MMMKKSFVKGMLLFFIILSFSVPAFSGTYSQIVVFGDSLSDNGSDDGFGFTVSSNGDVWADYLAEELDLSLLDMAFGGAKTNSHPNAPAENPEMYGFRWQIDTYINSIGSGSADEDALYVIWIGGNDLLNITDPASAGSVIFDAVTNISLGINDLAGAGAKNFLVINMPDLGKTPLMNGENTEFGDPFTDDPATGTQLAASFNAALDSAVEPFSASVNILKLDIFSLMTVFINQGLFVDYLHMLQAEQGTAEDDTYLFWDSIHPTTYTHDLVSDEILEILDPVPGAATLVYPDESCENPVTFIWDAVPGATWYYLWVNDSTGNIIKKWYTAAQSGCDSGDTCLITPDTGISGSSTWWIQTWNDDGFGPWSNGMSFTVEAAPIPGAATLTSPSGTVSENTPTYTWDAVPGATWYYLWVNDSTGNIIKKWYTAAQSGCESDTTCSITPDTTVSGNSTWWIKTWNDNGYGPWSSAMEFSSL